MIIIIQSLPRALLTRCILALLQKLGACPVEKREDREKANEEDTEGVCKCSEDRF